LVKKCDAHGHLYNASVYPECPYCNELNIDRDDIPKPKEVNPVSGWLVCVEAKNQELVGRDYTVVRGVNKIGSEPFSNEIVIDNDKAVSPREHAKLECNEFGVCYYNGKPLDTTKVSHGIKIGGGMYVYVPFEGNRAGLKFNWNDLDILDKMQKDGENQNE